MITDCLLDGFGLAAQHSFDGMDSVHPWDLIASNDYSVSSEARIFASGNYSEPGCSASILTEIRSVLAEQEDLKRRQDMLKAKQKWLEGQIGNAPLVMEGITDGILEWSEDAIQGGTGAWWEVTDPLLSPLYRAATPLYREEGGPSEAFAMLSEYTGAVVCNKPAPLKIEVGPTLAERLGEIVRNAAPPLPPVARGGCLLTLVRDNKSVQEVVLRGLGIAPLHHPLDTERSGGAALSDAMLRGALVGLAEAVASGEEGLCANLFALLSSEAGPTGSAMQRLTHFLVQSLEARAKGTAVGQHGPVSVPPSDPLELAGFLTFAQRYPAPYFWMAAQNAAIFHATLGHTNIHICDFGLWSGQWAALFPHFVAPKPCVRITLMAPPRGTPRGIGPLANPLQVMAEIRQASLAAGVECEARWMVGALDTFTPEMVGAREGEVLVFNCAARLSLLPDSSVMRSNPRDSALQRMRRMNPAVVVMMEINEDCNGQFFLPRFRCVLEMGTTLFKCCEALVQHDPSPRNPTAKATGNCFFTGHVGGSVELVEIGRRLFEEMVFSQTLRNVVACEGIHRTARHEPWGKWAERMGGLGFRHQTLPRQAVERLQAQLGRGGGLLTVDVNEGGAVEMRFKGRAMQWCSAWSPAKEAYMSSQTQRVVGGGREC